METVKPILTYYVRFRREKYKTEAKNNTVKAMRPTQNSFKDKTVCDWVTWFKHSPTSCAQFDPKRVSAITDLDQFQSRWKYLQGGL